METTDAILLNRWRRQRSADAFQRIVERYSGMVYSTCVRILGDAVLAEDVAQECFVELMSGRHSVRSLGPWLHTVATRRAIDRLRSHKRRDAREKSYAEACTAVSAAPDVAAGELLAEVDAAMAALPPNLRDVVFQRFLEGKTQREIAEASGVSEPTVRYRLERGVEKIRQTLRRKGITLAGGSVLAAMLDGSKEAPSAALLGRLGQLAISGVAPASPLTLGASAALTKAALAVTALVLAGAGIAAVMYANSPGKQDNHPPATPAGAGSAIREVPPESAPPVPPAPVEPAEAAPVEAAPAPVLAGRVYDEDTNEPIPAVAVRVTKPSGGRILHTTPPTGEDGTYTIADLEPGSYRVTIDSSPPRYPALENAAQVVRIEAGGPTVRVDFGVSSGVKVSGAVYWPNGQPAAGAEVGAKTTQNPNPVRGDADARGEYTLYMEGPADSLSIQARTGEAQSDTQQNILVPEGGVGGLDLVLSHPRLGRVSGVVVDADGNPMAGARVWPMRKGPTVFLEDSDQSDASGRFAVGGLAAGEYEVGITPEGVYVYSSAEVYHRFELAEGDQLEGIEIVYGSLEGAAVAGRVVDSGGEPISGVRVVCYGKKPHSARTESDGAFRISGLESGASYYLRAEHHEYSSASMQVASGVEDYVIRLQDMGGIRVRVSAADTGAPIPRFWFNQIIGRAGKRDAGLYSWSKEVTSEAGLHEREGVPAGDVTVAAWADGYAPVVEYLSVAPGGTAEIELRLPPVEAVEGVVVDTHGSPVKGAGIYFVEAFSMSQMDRAIAARTDGAGRFLLRSLPADAARLCAYLPGYAIGAAPLDGNVRIVLEPAASLRGTVRGMPEDVARTSIVLRYPDSPYLPSMQTQLEPDGTFAFAGLTPGAAALEVLIQGDGPRLDVHYPCQVHADAQNLAEVYVEMGDASVEGILYSGGEPVRNASVVLSKATDAGRQGYTARLGMEGAYAFTALPSGTYTLQVTRVDPQAPREIHRDEFDLVLSPGEAAVQDLTLPPVE